MRNPHNMITPDLSALHTLKDATFGSYMFQLAMASEKISHLKAARAENIIKRAILLWCIRRTLMQSVRTHRELVIEWTQVSKKLEAIIYEELKAKNYESVAQLTERLRVTQEDYAVKKALLEAGCTPETKRTKLIALTAHSAQLTADIQRQNQQLVTEVQALQNIEKSLAAHILQDAMALEHTSQPKKSLSRGVPSIYQPIPQTVDETVRAARQELTAAVVHTYLTAVYRGELDTVDKLLKAIPALAYAQGDLTDLSKRTFTRITGFQYAVWALDAPMWEIILQYLPPEDAAIQIKAYEERLDLMDRYGMQYSFDPLLAEYDNYIKNYAKWDHETCCHHWQKGVGAAQAMMPSWMIYAFTEPGDKVSWVTSEVEKGYLRVLSNEFRDFQKVIESGNGFLRFTWVGAYPEVVWKTGTAKLYRVNHDRDMTDKFKTKSQGQRQELTTIILTAPHRNTSSPR